MAIITNHTSKRYIILSQKYRDYWCSVSFSRFFVNIEFYTVCQRYNNNPYLYPSNSLYFWLAQYFMGECALIKSLSRTILFIKKETKFVPSFQSKNGKLNSIQNIGVLYSYYLKQHKVMFWLIILTNRCWAAVKSSHQTTRA